MPERPALLADAYAECERLARSHYENFPVASYLLPAAMRPHVAALYAFARVADDIADEGDAGPAARRSQLERWQASLHRAVVAPGDEAGAADLDRDPAPTTVPAIAWRSRRRILIAVGHSLRSLGLPVALFDDLVSAFGQDIMTTRYDSWCDVLDYCRRSANPVGRLVLRIAGYRDDRLDRSSDALCTALQLTNFWQDLGRDWRIGRLYVPAETVRAAGRRGNAARRAPDRCLGSAIEICVAFTRAQFGKVAPSATACADGFARSCGSPGGADADVGAHGADAGIIGRRARDVPCWSGALSWSSLRHGGTSTKREARIRVFRFCVFVLVGIRRTAAVVMARKTSFYYSFVLLAEQRRAIVRCGTCRAVDDAVDEVRRPAMGPPAATRSVCRARRCFGAAQPQTRQGRRLQPLPSLQSSRAAFDDVIDGGDGPRHHQYETLPT